VVLFEIHRKKIGASGDKIAAVVDHFAPKAVAGCFPEYAALLPGYPNIDNAVANPADVGRRY
jgi:hypothetical protein